MYFMHPIQIMCLGSYHKGFFEAVIQITMLNDRNKLLKFLFCGYQNSNGEFLNCADNTYWFKSSLRNYYKINSLKTSFCFLHQ